MSSNILGQKAFTTTKWSGGSTTELFISPKSAKFAKRNFDYRISIATVEVDESSFTPYPGVERTTLVLEGNTELTHENGVSKTLSRFESDTYDGGMTTKSIGKSTNFNVMTRIKAKASVEARALEADEQAAISTKKSFVLYVHSGRIAVIKNHQPELVATQNVYVTDDSNELIIVKALEESEIVLVSIE